MKTKKKQKETWFLIFRILDNTNQGKKRKIKETKGKQQTNLTTKTKQKTYVRLIIKMYERQNKKKVL